MEQDIGKLIEAAQSAHNALMSSFILQGRYTIARENGAWSVYYDETFLFVTETSAHATARIRRMGGCYTT